MSIMLGYLKRNGGFVERLFTDRDEAVSAFRRLRECGYPVLSYVEGSNSPMKCTGDSLWHFMGEVAKKGGMIKVMPNFNLAFWILQNANARFHIDREELCVSRDFTIEHQIWSDKIVVYTVHGDFGTGARFWWEL